MNRILAEPAISYHRSPVRSKDYIIIQNETSISQNLNWEKKTHGFFKEKNVTSFDDSKYRMEIAGEKFELYSNLKLIGDQIEDGAEILSRDENWDDDGALATDTETFLKAARFIVQYANHVHDKYHETLTAPYIDILRDGAVSVHWEAENNAQLLVVFKKKENELAYFFAEQGERKIPLKSAIVPNDPVDETLALWMKNYLNQKKETNYQIPTKYIEWY